MHSFEDFIEKKKIRKNIDDIFSIIFIIWEKNSNYLLLIPVFQEFLTKLIVKNILT